MKDLVTIGDGPEEIDSLIQSITPPKEGEPNGVFHIMREGCGQQLFRIGLRSEDSRTVDKIRVALGKNGFPKESRVLGAKMDTMERTAHDERLKNPLSRPPVRGSSPPERASRSPMPFKLK